jgi:hypothetical protein
VSILAYESREITMAKNHYLIVSYMPRLVADPRRLLTREDLVKLLPEWEKQSGGEAMACLWGAKDGHAHPILMINHAQSLIDHLTTWAEGVPQRWFNLHIYYSAKYDRYAVALIPKLEMSIERHKLQHKLNTGADLPKNATFSLLFMPIKFTSRPKPATFLKLRHMIDKKATLAFVEGEGLDEKTLGKNINSLDRESIVVGTFDVRTDDFQDYMETMFQQDSA